MAGRNISVPFKQLIKLKQKDLAGRRVIIRTDFNVPIKNSRIVDDYRIKQSLPALEFLSKRRAKIIIISHLGNEQTSLKPVVAFLNCHKLKTNFSELKKAPAAIKRLSPGELLLLENLRQYKGESKNSLNFTKMLAAWGDLYVNDAFSASHRRHASIIGLPKLLPALAGPLFASEYRHLSAVLSPKRPFMLILGGAKFATKVPLVRRYLSKADKIFIVGALAHTFFKARGYEIGGSLIDSAVADTRRFLKAENIYLPIDVVVKTPAGRKIKKPVALNRRDIIYDAGPETIKMIGREIKGMKTILWNGPLGQFETGFDRGTEAVARLIAKTRIYSVVGGGDTVAAIGGLRLAGKFNWLSTAGGAMIDFLATGALPGIDALKKSKKL